MVSELVCRLSREVRVKQLNVLSSCLVGVDCAREVLSTFAWSSRRLSLGGDRCRLSRVSRLVAEAGRCVKDQGVTVSELTTLIGLLLLYPCRLRPFV